MIRTMSRNLLFCNFGRKCVSTYHLWSWHNQMRFVKQHLLLTMIGIIVFCLAIAYLLKLISNEQCELDPSGTVTRQHNSLRFIIKHFDLHSTTNSNNDDKNVCPLVPVGLIGWERLTIVDNEDNTHSKDNGANIEAITTTIAQPSWNSLNLQFGWQPGKWRQPNWCVQMERLAVLVAYRNRESHLRRLLLHLHRLLPLQAAKCQILVIEQSGAEQFNRGSVFNAGYLEAIKQLNATCIIFHDVDMVPELPLNLYRCCHRPRLLSSALNKFNYKIFYDEYFGGVVAMTTEQFRLVNGYSNRFWGWGGEDDSMRTRVKLAGMMPLVTPVFMGRFCMARHKFDAGNEPNSERYRLLESDRREWKTEGLNTVNYRVTKVTHTSLFTLIRVVIPGPRPTEPLNFPLLNV